MGKSLREELEGLPKEVLREFCALAALVAECYAGVGCFSGNDEVDDVCEEIWDEMGVDEWDAVEWDEEDC